MTILVDDQLLSAILRRMPVPQVIPGEAIYTTGYWYVRLCQATLGAADRPGVLSGPLVDLPSRQRAQALAAIVALPASIGMLTLRQLGPMIGRLRSRHQLNVLGSEALAAAVQLDARVLLSATSPLLEAALALEGRDVLHVG